MLDSPGDHAATRKKKTTPYKMYQFLVDKTLQKNVRRISRVTLIPSIAHPSEG